MKKDLPLISIIMPTLNSADTIGLSLESVANQTYPKNKIEILVIDGGSKDKTIDIAHKYCATVLPNPKVQPEHAKSIGLKTAKGKYAMFLDSDEVLSNSQSIENKVKLFDDYPSCKNIVTTGLITPKNYPFLTNYVNKIGDPFSYFIYQIDGGNFYNSLSNHYQIEKQTSKFKIFIFKKEDLTPIVDGGGHFFDLDYLKSIANTNDSGLSARVFSSMVSHTHQLGVLSDDFVIHYSTSKLHSYLNKIIFRIISNLSNEVSNVAGYKNREKDISNLSMYKKYLFIPYSVTIILPLISSIILCINNKSLTFLIHFPLTLFTSISIIVLFIKIKILGLSQDAGIYG